MLLFLDTQKKDEMIGSSIFAKSKNSIEKSNHGFSAFSRLLKESSRSSHRAGPQPHRKGKRESKLLPAKRGQLTRHDIAVCNIGGSGTLLA